MISDFMAAELDYSDRCALLAGLLDGALALFPDCAAVWVPASGKLLTRQTAMDNPCRGPHRFLHFGVNARFFRIQGADDMLVDTLGMGAVGLPDVQYHYPRPGPQSRNLSRL